MAGQIFRPQAAERARPGSHAIVLRLSPWARFAVPAFAFCSIALLGVLAFLPYTETISGEGVLMPKGGLLRVTAPIDGTIGDVHIQEGAEVESGQALISVTQPQWTGESEARQDQQSALDTQARALNAELRAVGDRVSSRLRESSRMQSEFRIIQNEIERQIELQREVVSVSDDSLSRFSRLAESQLVSQIELSQALQMVLQAKQRLVDLQRELLASKLDASREAAEASAENNRAKEETQRIRRQLAALNSEWALELPRVQRVVKSSEPGRVTSLLIDKGDTVRTGQMMMSIATTPDDLVAEVYLPSASIGKIYAGISTSIELDSFPRMKFGLVSGRVISIATSPTRADDLVGSGRFVGSEGEILYRVVIALEEGRLLSSTRADHLRVGMRITAKFGVQKRRLYQYFSSR